MSFITCKKDSRFHQLTSLCIILLYKQYKKKHIFAKQYKKNINRILIYYIIVLIYLVLLYKTSLYNIFSSKYILEK